MNIELVQASATACTGKVAAVVRWRWRPDRLLAAVHRDHRDQLALILTYPDLVATESALVIERGRASRGRAARGSADQSHSQAAKPRARDAPVGDQTEERDHYREADTHPPRDVMVPARNRGNDSRPTAS